MIARPPRHVVVLAHPDPQSFNATIANTDCHTVRVCGQEAILRDLYAIGFDPVLKGSERAGTQGFALSKDVQDELAAIDGATCSRSYTRSGSACRRQ